MLMIPRRNNFDLFGEMFNDPFFDEPRRPHREDALMKTDIKEHADKYVIDMSLPGYKKENIKVSIEDGNLVISAHADNNKEEKDEHGKFIRRERYVGSCSRSFYVGPEIKETDIQAEFKNGTLSLEVPKKEEKKELPEKKYIEIK